MVTVTPSRVSEPPVPIFRERNQGTTVHNLPLSHLSIEVGHFYMEDLENGEEPIRAQFQRVKPWLEAAKASVVCGDEKPRISTCFLIDDYFQAWPDAPVIMEKLLRLAAETDVPIDYVARESACARRQDGFAVAELVAKRILEEPEPDRDTGGRPPTMVSGWLSNGRPTREATVLNVMESHKWDAPVEYAKRNHSIYVDVELWKDHADPGADDEEILSKRVYSCPFLAAVWQLVRLGLLRKDGAPALSVTDWDGQWREEWKQFPDIVKVNPGAKPFYAYQSLSIMPQHFLSIEHAVRTVIDHVLLDEPVVRSLQVRAQEKRIQLPAVVSERISHHFLPGGM
jgi:hypothetical protein